MKKKGLKILIMGLPGSGKTTLAEALHRELSKGWFTVHYNADEVRSSINHKLGFSVEDRNHQAFTMGWLADRVAEQGGIAICDFVCPTTETRSNFGLSKANYFKIFVDRTPIRNFMDTTKMFQPPQFFDYRVEDDHAVGHHVYQIVRELARQKYLRHERFR